MNKTLGIVIGLVLIADMAVIVNMTNKSDSTQNTGIFRQFKYMSGSEFMSNEQTPEARALALAFDEDNGVEYCVPNLTAAELGEFRASLASHMATAAFDGTINASVLNTDKPLKYMLRAILKRSHPCNN